MAESERKVRVYGTPWMPERKRTFPEYLVLRPMAKALWDGYAKAVDYIDGLSDKKLWHLREALEAAGRGNCGWLEYRLKDDLLQHVEWQIKQREAKRACK